MDNKDKGKRNGNYLTIKQENEEIITKVLF
jgi:hypothetical protein